MLSNLRPADSAEYRQYCHHSTVADATVLATDTGLAAVLAVLVGATIRTNMLSLNYIFRARGTSGPTPLRFLRISGYLVVRSCSVQSDVLVSIKIFFGIP